MIRVAAAKEPDSFETKVRQPGRRAIAELTGKIPVNPRTAGKAFEKLADREEEIPSEKFPPYWREALDDLLAAYQRICAYACFYIHPVTGAGSVDHFAPKSQHWDRVYEWSNYRLCCSRINARKSDYGGILDPFEVEDEWFQLELLGFQVVPNPSLDEATQLRIQHTIDALGLNDFRADREKDAERYWNRDYSLKILKLESPFVARELHRLGRLNPGDQW